MEIPGYKIEKELGTGGMSTVYLATQQSFGRKVALKILAPGYVSSEESAARFMREAKIIAGMSHPHIVPVYDVGNHGEFHYMSMDCLTGGDLLQWISRGLEIDEILQIMEDIATALHYAHGKGYVHRDIKPNNILFREDGSPVLTDFGISRLLNANDQVTQSGAIIGTPRYMSPESLQGKAIDGRTDIYSLGIVFYEMLMKEPPYQAEEYMALGIKHIKDPIPVLPKRFERFQGFLEKLMAKNPKDRYQSGLEVVKAIRALRAGEILKSNSAELPLAETVIAGDILKQHQDDDKGAETGKKSALDAVKVGDYLLKEENTDLPKPKAALSRPTSKNPVHEKIKSDAARLTRVKEGTMFREESYKKWIFFTRYIFICEMTTYDAVNFSIIFSTITTKLQRWHEKHGRKAAVFTLDLTSTERVFDKAKAMMEQLYQHGEIFEFLKKCDVKLKMHNLETGTEEIYIPGIQPADTKKD